MDNVKVNSTNDSSNENDFTAVNLTDIFSAGTSEVDISSLPVSVEDLSLKTKIYSNMSESRSETVNDVTTESSEQQSTVSQITVEDGVLNEVTTTTQITTVDGVTSESSTTETRTIVLSPDMNFSDIIEQYSSLPTENVDYAITGRNGNSEQHFDAKNSDSYLSSLFYDVGNRNGYLTDFVKNSGVINFVDNAVSSYLRQSDYVSFNMANGTSFQAQTGESANDILQYSTDGENVSYAKLGYQDAINTFIYEKGVNFYGGGNFEDVLKVIESSAENIWLDGSQGVSYGNINSIDATESTGDNQLAGNANDNEIRAGSGNNLLWGQGGNDTLFGGAGTNTFFYGLNEGNDVIYNSALTDKINLYNVSLTDIVSAKEIGDNLLIEMSGGETLRIVGENGASNFTFSDGSSYTYNRENNTWTQNE
ncbi:MAG: hypothetical protein IJU91_01130 [Selenomonadaceae bacterium]|nr:hypothetical protein [Selenomonadaceae bacterium]